VEAWCQIMKKITLRTKIEATLAILLLVSIVAASVVSLTRTISDSHDDFDTFIKNSKGNYWECTGENVQVAIWDLNSTDGGTVWVGDDVTLSSPLRLRNNVILDFEKNQVTLDSDIEFIIVTACQYATVENVKILPTATHTESIIKLYIPPGGGWSDKARYNTFENIQITNTGYWIPNVGFGEHNYTGIELHIAGGSNFLCNTFRDIQMAGVGTGILFNQTWTSGWANGNYFENIWIDQYVTAIRFKRNPSATFNFNQNVFTHIKAQSAVFTEYGVRDICGNGNRFDHILMWDWYAPHNSGTAVYEYSISSASNTYINAHAWYSNGLYVIDEGSNTMLITNGKIQIGG